MWGCFLMSGVKILHFLKDWWKSIPIHQNYTMALIINKMQYKPPPPPPKVLSSDLLINHRDSPCDALEARSSVLKVTWVSNRGLVMWLPTKQPYTIYSAWDCGVLAGLPVVVHAVAI